MLQDVEKQNGPSVQEEEEEEDDELAENANGKPAAIDPLMPPTVEADDDELQHDLAMSKYYNPQSPYRLTSTMQDMLDD